MTSAESAKEFVLLPMVFVVCALHAEPPKSEGLLLYFQSRTADVSMNAFVETSA